MLNADLHSHSYVSDGILAPAELAARAKANGVDIWALTDHDEISGVAEARAAAAAIDLRFVAGVEISVTWSESTVHIVGLRIDETNSALVSGLEATRGGREQRAHEMARQLALVGVPDAFDGALKFAGNLDLISRTHFARYVIELGICSNVGEVFRKFMIEGKPGFVPHRWATLRQAVTWIRDAGGIAVVAHPGRYKFSELVFDEFVNDFKQYGGAAMEVMTGSHSVDQYGYYAGIVRRYDLMASRGSDFHGPGESRVDLGALPALPENVVPVWHDWLL